MSNDLNLNSIDRFEKQSERLILEEHGHCEVPAGCGGVVLRWFNPNSGIPVVFHSGFAEELTLFIDGEQLTSGRATIAFGEHVLAMHAVFTAAPYYLWLSGLRDTAEDRYPEENRVIPELTTSADGTWRATLTEPANQTWTEFDFDDNHWAPLPTAQLDEEEMQLQASWNYNRMIRLGAGAFELGARPEMWIRKRFQMEQ